MPDKLPKGHPWNLDVMQTEEPDRASIWVVKLSVLVDARPALAGRIVAYEDDPAFVEEVFSNELLLPHRDAQRLLRRLWDDWHGTATEYGGCGMEMLLDLEGWLADHYEDGGKEVMGFIHMTLNTFA